jgi:hypothetical protein
MEQPPNVGRELGGFRAGKQHAVIQRVKKSRFTDPAPALHEFLVHDGDLAARSAEADESEFQSEAKCFGESRVRASVAVRHRDSLGQNAGLPKDFLLNLFCFPL